MINNTSLQLHTDEEWLRREEAILSSQPARQYKPQHYHDAPQDCANDISRRHGKVEPKKILEALISHDVFFPIAYGNNEVKPVTLLPPQFQELFPYKHFNRFQSQCFDQVYHSDRNLAVSAPTGCGKTVLLELAILRLLSQGEKTGKIIYMAPTKALSSPRSSDWEQRFSSLGLSCQELTGDTDFVSFDHIRKCNIIITTPEKWDSMTRRWPEHKKLMTEIKLCMVDEVHIVREVRGATLEACISRMKMTTPDLRIIALSATVPNIDDIASWLDAQPLQFGEEYRQVKLSRYVYGFQDINYNPFMFEKRLEWKLYNMLQKHNDKKPSLIFCSTRKSAQSSCETIIKVMKQRSISNLCNLPGAIPTTKDKKLQDYMKYGVAFHHAGLETGDRKIVERLFLAGHLAVVATTSTLAVGINLPAHLVIIKSTKAYMDGKFQEYTDLDMLQMIGRAGRPGFDESGCAVILTTSDMQRKYEKMLSGQELLESTYDSLHQNMIEHLNAEICLRTIYDTPTGIAWLRSTFLYVRVQKNPYFYKLEANSNDINAEKILENICLKHLASLATTNVITMSPYKDIIAPTCYGEAMAKYYIKFDTLKNIISAERNLSLRAMLELLTRAKEYDNFRYNTGEKSVLNTLNKHPNIRFRLKGKLVSISDKIFLLIQAFLGGIPLNDSKLAAVHNREIYKIKQHAWRILQCVAACMVYNKDGISLESSLHLQRSLNAKSWENSVHLLKQLEGIGPQYAKILSDSGIQNLQDLLSSDPRRLEMILHRNPPFGSQILEAAMRVPQFNMVTDIKWNTNEPVKMGLSIVVKIELKNAGRQNSIFHKGSYASFWAMSKNGKLIDFRKLSVYKLDQPKALQIHVPEEHQAEPIICHIDNENFVGHGTKVEIRANTNSGACYDSNFWDSVPDQFWENIGNNGNAEKCAQLDLNRCPNYKPLEIGREMCQHKCKNWQLCGHECCKSGKRRKAKASGSVTLIEKVVPPPQDTLVSHRMGTMQQARGEVLFLPTRNQKIVKRPKPTEEENHTMTLHNCEQINRVIAGSSTPSTKKLRLNTDDDFTVMDNASEKKDSSYHDARCSESPTSRQYTISRTTDRISLDCTKCTSPYSFDDSYTSLTELKDPYTELMEFEEENILENSPENHYLSK